MKYSRQAEKLFEGFRGSPPSDIQALEDLLLRLSAMVEDIPQMAELGFNPVKVMPKGEGYWIVDVRIRSSKGGLVNQAYEILMSQSNLDGNV